MPRGPKGEKRVADVVGNAVLVMKIATGALWWDASDGERRIGMAKSKRHAVTVSPH